MKIKFGVLGAAKIAREKVIPAMQLSEFAQLESIASRDPERAREAAHNFAAPRSHESYEALLQDPEIAAVYIPFPNDMHVEWAIKALHAQKHVLCEKPLGLNASEVALLMELAAQYPHLKIMEAFMYRSHPQWQYAIQEIRSGKIGKPRLVHARFSYCRDVPSDYRNRPEAGGGGLLDIGCYGISVARWVFDSLPTRVTASAEFDPRHQVDRLFHGLAEFPCGGSASIMCGTQVGRSQGVSILGETGSIDFEWPYYQNSEFEGLVRVETESAQESRPFYQHNHYQLMLDDFCQAIINDRPLPISLEDSRDNARSLDAFAESMKQKNWVTLL